MGNIWQLVWKLELSYVTIKTQKETVNQSYIRIRIVYWLNAKIFRKISGHLFAFLLMIVSCIGTLNPPWTARFYKKT